MRKLAIIICMLSLAALSFGQEAKGKAANMDKSKLMFNVGVGLSGWGIPVYAGGEYWFTPEISGGLEVSFRYNLWWNYAVVGGGIFGNYHFTNLLKDAINLPDKFDVYAGLSVGPYIDLGGYWVNPLHIGAGLQLGGRYQLNDRMAVQVELGGGTLSGGKIGLTFRR
jgi:hypothetical protein